MKKFILILCLLFPFNSWAIPNYITGQQLLDYCRVALDVFDKNSGRVQTEGEYTQGVKAGICEGYLIKVNELLQKNNIGAFCVPENRMAEVVAAVAKYLKDNPQLLQTEASALIIDAFKKYFPCR